MKNIFVICFNIKVLYNQDIYIAIIKRKCLSVLLVEGDAKLY